MSGPTVIVPPGSPGTPTAPGMRVAAGVPGTPAAPGSAVAGGGAEGVLVAGELTPETVLGLLLPGPPAGQGGEPRYTSTGSDGLVPMSTFVSLSVMGLVTPEAATLDAIAPPENYEAGETVYATFGSFGTGTAQYRVRNTGGGNYWSKNGEDAASDFGGDTIAAGNSIDVAMVGPTTAIPFAGGLGATWQANPAIVRRWSLVGIFWDGMGAPSITYQAQGTGVTPDVISWSAPSAGSGTPSLTVVSGTASPVAPEPIIP